MNILAYVCLGLSAWVFSVWSWNRMAAASGNAEKESFLPDLLFAVATPVAAASIKILFFTASQ